MGHTTGSKNSWRNPEINNEISILIARTMVIELKQESCC